MIGLLIFSVVAWTGYHLWFQPPLTISLAYGVGSLLLVGVVAIVYSRSSAVLVARLEAAKQQREKDVADLLKELSENGLLDAVKQGKRLLETIASFGAVSLKRFKGSGLTLSSYIEAAKDLEASILHNLREMLIAHQSIQSIRDNESGNEDVDPRRKELVESQMSKISRLSEENQEAITLLS